MAEGIKVIFCFALFATVFSASDTAAIGGNSCVDCHKKAETIASLRPWQIDTYFSWKGSVHGQKEVTCEKCHGGDPTQTKKNRAHQGVLNAIHPDSMIFYKKVPQTCGLCHQEIYEGFTRSKHYQSLKEDKLVPSCTTCHGFHMGIGGANLYELATKCAVCHNERRKVYPKVPLDVSEILNIAHRIEETLVKSGYLLDLARERRLSVEPLEDRLRKVKADWNNVSPLWHTFDLEKFEREAKATLKEADQVYSQSKELCLKGK